MEKRQVFQGLEEVWCGVPFTAPDRRFLGLSHRLALPTAVYLQRATCTIETRKLSRPNKRNNSVALFEYLLNVGFSYQ